MSNMRKTLWSFSCTWTPGDPDLWTYGDRSPHISTLGVTKDSPPEMTPNFETQPTTQSPFLSQEMDCIDVLEVFMDTEMSSGEVV